MKSHIKENNKNKNTDNIRLLNTFLIQYFHLVIIVFIVAFILLSLFLLLLPKYNSIQNSIEVSNENKEKEKEALIAYNLRLDGYIASFEKINDSNRDRIYTLLPDDDLKENLFVRFEDLVRRRGLLLESLTVEASDVESALNPDANKKRVNPKKTRSLPEGVGSVVIGINLLGIEYEELKEFLAIIEKNLRIMDINNLSFNNDNKSLSLTITTYFNYFDRLQ
jgi:hypothetical protein